MQQAVSWSSELHRSNTDCCSLYVFEIRPNVEYSGLFLIYFFPSFLTSGCRTAVRHKQNTPCLQQAARSLNLVHLQTVRTAESPPTHPSSFLELINCTGATSRSWECTPIRFQSQECLELYSIAFTVGYIYTKCYNNIHLYMDVRLEQVQAVCTSMTLTDFTFMRVLVRSKITRILIFISSLVPSILLC
jgi:hypothetical protein